MIFYILLFILLFFCMYVDGFRIPAHPIKYHNHKNIIYTKLNQDKIQQKSKKFQI
jgi:hypothetical protein